uniref:Uncharacterized protein n=1 Tax=Romanomermis culicivorax TaxID=13658 RepID=A0A915LCI4_ROMCU
MAEFRKIFGSSSPLPLWTHTPPPSPVEVFHLLNRRTYNTSIAYMPATIGIADIERSVLPYTNTVPATCPVGAIVMV